MAQLVEHETQRGSVESKGCWFEPDTISEVTVNSCVGQDTFIRCLHVICESVPTRLKIVEWDM